MTRKMQLDDDPAAPVRQVHLMLLVDGSGSMASLRRAVVDFVNEQIAKAKENSSPKMITTVSLMTFADYPLPPALWRAPIGEVKPWTLDDYIPAGGTALYDALGDFLDLAGKDPDAGDEELSFLLYALTDGMNNASKRWDAQRIAQRLETLQVTDRWTVGYMGANQDLRKLSQELKLDASNFMAFDAQPEAMRATSALNASATDDYYTARYLGAKSVKSLYSTDNRWQALDDLLKRKAELLNKKE